MKASSALRNRGLSQMLPSQVMIKFLSPEHGTFAMYKGHATNQHKRHSRYPFNIGSKVVFFCSLAVLFTRRILVLQSEHGNIASTNPAIYKNPFGEVSRFRGATLARIEEESPESDNELLEEQQVVENVTSAPIIVPEVTGPADPYGGMTEEEKQKEIAGRAQRFPSVTDRVRVYMSDWYTPPCQGNVDAFIKYDYAMDGKKVILQETAAATSDNNVTDPRLFELDNDETRKTLFFPNRERIEQCLHEYCNITQDTIFPSVDHVNHEFKSDTPVILQFGDGEFSFAPLYGSSELAVGPDVPILKKYRVALNRGDLYHLTYAKVCYRGARHYPSQHATEHQLFQPIIWKLDADKYLSWIPNQDIPWSQKQDAAIFRGGLTGVFSHGLTPKDLERDLSDGEICSMIPRCRMVLEYHQSELVNARLTRSDLDEAKSSYADYHLQLDDVVDGVSLYDERVPRADFLKYKAIIMVEGDGAAAGLDWALLSNSVVLMQPPTRTSWLMEELLVPWVHYVPLDDYLSDVEEKVKWVIDNPHDAQLIANQGARWVRDLLFHPEAEKDEEDIFDEIMRRYRAHFLKKPDLASTAITA